MFISLNWLKRLADIPDMDIKKLGDRVTMSIAEVDDIIESAPHLNSVFSAKILKIDKIPETEHLQVTQIDTGDEKLQVVCGAPNISVGDIIPLAKIGTVLPLEDGKTLKIKKGKLRGVESCGMLCSAKELKLSSDHSGIMILPEDTPLNKPISSILKDVDTLFEIDNKSITHRPDLWGHLGFAREIAAVTNGKLKEPSYNKGVFKDQKGDIPLTVTIEQPEHCRRYSGVVIKDVVIKESPKWIQTLLISMGLTPINNIVDITNFVMMELGQPMHAFDLQKLSTPDIFVRFAKKGEKIVALDENSYNLTEKQLVIADKNGPIALAGVIGGELTKIDNNTTDIVLESANFKDATIRRCATYHSIRTDSSNRFEKSLDPENTVSALELAYHLIKESSSNAKIGSELIDNYPTSFKRIYIEISDSYINKKLGIDVGKDRIRSILTSLHFNIISDIDGVMKIEVPTFRATKDISIKADIVEEIGRIYGYDNIPDKPFLSKAIPPLTNQERVFERFTKNCFVNRYNFDEVYNYSFVSEDDIKLIGEDPDNYIELKNALSKEYTKIRRDLFISSLNTIFVNSKNFNNFKFFEVGRGYLTENRDQEGLPEEKRYLMAVEVVENSESSKNSFYNLRAIAEDYFQSINFKGIKLEIPNNISSNIHPHRYLVMKRGKDVVAKIGEISPKLLLKKGINLRAVALELDLSTIFGSKFSKIKFKEPSKFPYTTFEVTVIANKKDYIENILHIAEKGAKKLVQSVELLTIYEGNPIPEDKKAVSLKVVLGSDERTLKTKEIDKALQNIIKQLEKNGFLLRR